MPSIRASKTHLPTDQGFEQFYRTVYLQEHRNPMNRRIHFASNCGVVASLLVALSTRRWGFAAAALGFQLVPPFLGHVFFEGSHQSVERSSLFSILGSWRMFLEFLTGRQRL